MGTKCIGYPLKFSLAIGLIIDSNNIKAAGQLVSQALFEQIILRCFNDFVLLTKIHTFSGRFKAAIATQANFYKYQCFAIAHDQINLTAFATIVFVPGLQALAMQKFLSTGFGIEAFG